jgi:hypothetical protein
MKMTTHLLMLRSRMSGAIPPPPSTSSWCGAYLSTGTTLHSPYHIEGTRYTTTCGRPKTAVKLFLNTKKFYGATCIVIWRFTAQMFGKIPSDKSGMQRSPDKYRDTCPIYTPQQNPYVSLSAHHHFLYTVQVLLQDVGRVLLFQILFSVDK